MMVVVFQGGQKLYAKRLLRVKLRIWSEFKGVELGNTED